MNGREVVIVGCTRTPVGSFLGGLKDVTAQTLCACVIREALRRAGVSDADVDEVVMGNCISTDSTGNMAREALLAAKLPFTIPAFTLSKNCASALKSVAQGALAIKAGEADVVVAGGMESMSRVPYVLNGARTGYRMRHVQLTDALLAGLDGMGMTAERLAEKYKISRQEQDEFACLSQMKAARAQAAGTFDAEITPITVPQRKAAPIIVSHDEGLKPQTTMEVLAKLPTVFKENGTVTAGNSSTINDAAAAVVLCSAEKACTLGLKPLVKVKAWAAAGCEPDIMGFGPVPATRRLLKKTGLALDDFDLVELNESFAAQSLAVLRELPVRPERLNVNGGAIALGHPTGATGSVLITRLVYEMKRRQAALGLVTLCIGGGQGMSLALENV